MSHGLILSARSTSVTPFQRAGLWVVMAASRGQSTALVHYSVAVGLRAVKVDALDLAGPQSDPSDPGY